MADETQQEGGLGGVEVKGMKTPFGGTYAGNVVTAASPELLKNMQDMIDQRTGGFNSFLEGMKDAVAITSRDPSTAMAARDQEKRLGQQSIFEIRQQMAMMKQQEKQAALQQAHLERQLANFGLNVPGVSSEGVGRTAGGGLVRRLLPILALLIPSFAWAQQDVGTVNISSTVGGNAVAPSMTNTAGNAAQIIGSGGNTINFGAGGFYVSGGSSISMRSSALFKGNVTMVPTSGTLAA